MILHVDLNSFYASCTVVESGGRYTFDTPLMVCGDPKLRHGIVLAATYPVKRTGVRAGMPLWEARARCPQAIIAEPDYRLYISYSERFMRIIEDYSPVVMRYGIDEAYLDYSGCEHLFGAPEAAANTIRERVKRELGLTVSVGVGENPLMAKMGSDYKKPDAVTVIDSQSWRRLIWPLPVENLMYVGRSSMKRLNALGVHTIGELARIGPEALGEAFGRCGPQLWRHANGVDDTRLEDDSGPQKCISSSVTLPRDVTTREGLAPVLLARTEKVAYKLRESKMNARVVGIQVRFRDLSHSNRQRTLYMPTDVTSEIYSEVKRLLRDIPLPLPVRQAGVRVAELTAGGEQLSLINADSHDRQHRLDAAADAIRRKYGAGILKRCSTMASGHDDPDGYEPPDAN